MLPVTRGTPLLRIAQMGAAFAASDLLSSAIGLATSLVIARGLGRDGFGRWTLCAAAASGLTAAFDLGFGVLLTRDAARQDDDIGSIVTAALTARLALFLPVGLFVYAGAPGAGAGAVPAATLHAVAMLAAAGIAYGCVAAIYRASPRRLVAILTVETIGAGVQCAGAVLIVRAGGTIADLLRLAAGVQMAQLVAALALWRLVAPHSRLERPSVASAWAHLRRALPFALTGFVASAHARMAPLLLGYLSSAVEVAAFGVASRLESIARRVPHAAFGAALPVFAHESTHGRSESLRARFDGALRWFAIAAALVIVVAATPIVRLTYGDRFAEAAWPLMWAGVGLVPSLVNNGRKVHLYAAGAERVALRWSVVALAVHAAAGVALIPHFGAAGAMWSLGIAEAAVWLPLRAVDKAVTPEACGPAPGAPEASSALRDSRAEIRTRAADPREPA